MVIPIAIISISAIWNYNVCVSNFFPVSLSLLLIILFYFFSACNALTHLSLISLRFFFVLVLSFFLLKSAQSNKIKWYARKKLTYRPAHKHTYIQPQYLFYEWKFIEILFELPVLCWEGKMRPKRFSFHCQRVCMHRMNGVRWKVRETKWNCAQWEKEKDRETESKSYLWTEPNKHTLYF